MVSRLRDLFCNLPTDSAFPVIHLLFIPKSHKDTKLQQTKDYLLAQARLPPGAPRPLQHLQPLPDLLPTGPLPSLHTQPEVQSLLQVSLSLQDLDGNSRYCLATGAYTAGTPVMAPSWRAWRTPPSMGGPAPVWPCLPHTLRIVSSSGTSVQTMWPQVDHHPI